MVAQVKEELETTCVGVCVNVHLQHIVPPGIYCDGDDKRNGQSDTVEKKKKRENGATKNTI
jgi:hypothetical protein